MLRLVWVCGVIMMLLLPTGMCVCGDDDNETPSASHEPGCPKVRKLDRSEPPTIYHAPLVLERLPILDDEVPRSPLAVVVRTSRGPPPDKPVYLVLQTWLI